MSNSTFRRRDLAAGALLAFSPLLARQAFAAPKLRVSSSSTKTTTTSTTASVDTCTYGLVPLDSSGKANFANRVWNPQRDTGKSYALEQSTDVTPLRHRFEVRSGDTWSGETGRNRSEFSSCARECAGREVWFSYAMRIHGGAPVSDWNVLGQFHSTADPGEGNGLSPPFAVCLMPGEKLRFVKRTDSAALTSTSPRATVLYERGVSRDRWYRIVGRIVFGWTDNGAVDLWMDGVKVVGLPQTNIGYNDLIGPYWKFGIYRAQAAETLTVEYANLEICGTSLLTRVTSPLQIV
jgi:hypothetical protein